MLPQRTLVIVIVSLCASAHCLTAKAQNLRFLHNRPNDNSDFTTMYEPFSDLETSWFEPIHGSSPDDRPLNSGWFFEYSRMNLNVSRPRNESGTLVFDVGGSNNLMTSVYQSNEPSDFQGDWTWGNRFDFGWMSEDGTGLWFVARKLDNPNQRLEFNNVDSNGDELLRLDNEPWGPTFVTLNGFNMWGFEMNKVWRLPPTPRGTLLEPFIGPRYVRLRDHADRTDVFTDTLRDFPLTLAPNAISQRRMDFNYRQALITTDNDLFGGQFGIRSRWRRGRWHITSDIRGLAFWNHQVKEIFTDNEIQQQDWAATYDEPGNIAAINPVNGNVVQTSRQENDFKTNNTFVYGGELNLQAAFEVTQGFALTFGGEVLAFADGVGRGHSGIDDSLVLAGFSFGFTLNR